MHNNYFFLKHLSGKLQQKITGWNIGACFSQEKNEIVFTLISGDEEMYIRASQDPAFSCLSFPHSFSRARRNSIDLFPAVVGRRILGIHQYKFERAFAILLEGNSTLLFKLFGNFSNVLFYEEGECTDVFKHNLGDEEKLDPEKLDRDLRIEESEFYAVDCNPRKLIPAIDNRMMDHLRERGFDDLDRPGKWHLLTSFLQELENPLYYILREDEKIRFSLIRRGEILQKSDDPILAVTDFYYTYLKNHRLSQEKSRLLKTLRDQLKKTEQYIIKTGRKLDEGLGHPDYRQQADILMANLHVLDTGMEEAELFDFYHNRKIKIRLNPRISPQKNAEQFYRKAKNRNKEIDVLKNNISLKKGAAERLRKQMKEIEEAGEFRSLRKLNEKMGTGTGTGKKEETARFKIYDHMGFRILVGRNARNNEELTFEYGYKDDLWLHARDVSGSHVLVKYQAGKKFPAPVIEMAGQLAAYYSRNRNMKACPVIYTEKKYVRKIKSAPAGTVRVEKENIIFVNPSDQS